MLYTFPNYYKEFSCIADECEDTCCAVWQIVIDPRSLKKYKNVQGSYAKCVKDSIRWRKGIFKQDQEGRCAFLNEDNLCNLYSNLGPESLCKTCRHYPRHIEEFENVREITLSLSCPEVAGIFLSQKEPVTFVSFENEKEEEIEDFDVLFYSILEECREKIYHILQDRTKSIENRAGMIYAICHDIQVRIEHQELFSCDELYDKYETERASRFVDQKIETYLKDSALCYETMKGLFEQFSRMERLKKDWSILLMETRECLYRKGPAEYARTVRSFEGWKKSSEMWEIWMEQLLVYFISTYFCGAVYDGDAFSKMMMALSCVAMIHELSMARWIKNEGIFDMEDMKEIIYRFSREIEHSDPNLNRLEKIRF